MRQQTLSNIQLMCESLVEMLVQYKEVQVD